MCGIGSQHCLPVFVPAMEITPPCHEQAVAAAVLLNPSSVGLSVGGVVPLDPVQTCLRQPVYHPVVSLLPRMGQHRISFIRLDCLHNILCGGIFNIEVTGLSLIHILIP